MKVIRLLKPVLLIQEIFRIIIIVLLLLLRSEESSTFIMVFFAAQGVLFPLMAVFLCLNTARYKEYLPLYIAGKTIGVFLILCWSLLTQQVTMIEGFFNERSLLIIDLTAILLLIIIKNDVRVMTLVPEKQIITNNQNVERLKQLKRLKQIKRLKRR